MMNDLRSTKLFWFAGVTLLASAVVAQQSNDGPYILHEYVEASSDSNGGSAGDSRAGSETAPGQPPALSMETQDDELVYGAEGPLDDGRWESAYGELNPFSASNKLDDRTDRVDSLNYFASFDPSVIPYKRVVAQNAVAVTDGGDYFMTLNAGVREPQSIGVAGPDTELFWGSFMMRTEANRLHPVASVAPNQVILDVRSEPQVDLTVVRDNAGNFYFRTAYAGLLRLNIHVAVPTSYFNGSFEGATWADFDALTTDPLPPNAAAVALRVRNKLGFTRNSTPAAVLTSMVEHFRDFEGKPFPEGLRGRGDLYETIATSKIGVCRHRSLAFVITARSLGIPAHYVYNEAHAFAEVYWPGIGFRRIDLGGAANELNAASNSDQSVHSAADDLPRPPRFVEEQERMKQNGWLPSGEPSEGGASTNNAEGNAATNNGGTNNGGQPTGESTSETEQPDQRASVDLRLLDATEEVKRGGVIRLLGRLTTTAGRPLVSHTVEVHLGPVGSERPSAQSRIATLKTNGRGDVNADVEIPANQSIGRWSLFLVFPGDPTFKPAIAK